MAENTLVKEHLTDAMVAGGEALTRKLDELGLPVNASFWFFDPEVNEWGLHFASSEVASKGPRYVYERVGNGIDQLGAIGRATPLSVVRVLEADAEVVKLLGALVRTGPAIGRFRLRRNAVNGHFIEDALIYRMS